MFAALQSLLPFVVCLASAAVLTPVARIVARRYGCMDIPSSRKAHRSPTPLLGGTAVFAAIAIGTVAFGLLSARTAGIAVGASIVFGLGLWDDVRGMPPGVKFLGQIAAALVPISLGLVAHVTGITLVDGALTLFWLVGLANALNLLDNMDGISSGVAAVVALFTLFMATVLADAETSRLALCLLGAALGFLIYNFPPARIFLGDAGSMVFGFMVAALNILLMNDVTRTSDMLAPAALVGLPALDTILVMVMRRREGRRVSQAGKDHISHRLAAVGLAPRCVAWAHYGLAAAFGAAGVAYLGAETPLRITLFVAVVATGVLVGVWLGRVRLDPVGDRSGLQPGG